MTLAAEMIITRGGTVLPLDQRIADALMNYAQQAADTEGLPRQTWVRRYWPLKEYEAKDVLKGNASKAIYERILKRRGPHCGWFVGLAITGAVIGQPVHEFFREQTRQAAKENERAQEHERLARAAYRRLADDADLDRRDGDAAAPARQARRGAGAMGAEAARRVEGAAASRLSNRAGRARP